MTFRTFAAPVALAALLVSLPGCSFKSSSSELTGQDSISAGNAAYEQKDYAKACAELSKAGAAAGAEALYRAGDACGRDGMAKAQGDFKAALAANSGYAPAMEGLGLAAYAAGDLSQARNMLEAAVKAGGKSPLAATALGDVYLLSGQCDKAQAAYQEALHRDPGFSQARVRQEASRLVCATKKTATPAAASRASGPSGASGYSGSSVPPATSPAAGPKEPAKGKPATKTIDLNDI
jgi:tetratricopeptide (TPR) repeat protein